MEPSSYSRQKRKCVSELNFPTVNDNFPDLPFFHSSWSGQNASHVLRILLDERHYDKRFRPEFEGENAVVIQSLYGFY